MSNDVKYQASINKSKDYSGFFEVSSERLRKLGQFTLQINVDNEFTKYTFKDEVFLGTRTKILDLNFDVVDGKHDNPNFDHYVDEKEFYPRTLEANEGSFLHVVFKLQFEKGISIFP